LAHRIKAGRAAETLVDVGRVLYAAVVATAMENGPNGSGKLPLALAAAVRRVPRPQVRHFQVARVRASRAGTGHVISAKKRNKKKTRGNKCLKRTLFNNYSGLW
jgi:hypothetical protein